MNLKDVKELPIPIPPSSIRVGIEEIATALDHKIELNRQTNETLEAMAQALFKSWFVDFDPVIDNALAAGNDIPEPFKARAAVRQTLGDARKPLPEEIRREFPDGFEFRDEMGWVPRGWATCAIYDIATFINGASFKSNEIAANSDSLPIIKIAEVKNGVSGQTKFCCVDKGEKYLIDVGELFFSWSGNPETSIDTFVWAGGKGWLNQHVFKVIPDRDLSRTFVYNLLKHSKPTFTSTASNKQTTGLGHVTVKDLKRLCLCKHPAAVDELYTKNFESIGQKLLQNLLENKELNKVRDFLLPKLLSGQLTIPNAEKLVSDAT